MKGKRFNWAPYLLLLPSLIYLGMFFGWPMVQSLQLAFRRDSQILPLLASLEEGAPVVGQLEKGTIVTTLEIVRRERKAAGGLLTEKHFWLRVSGVNAEGETIEGWAERGDVFVKDATRSDDGYVVAETASVWAEPGAQSAVVAELPEGTPVTIVEWGPVRIETAADDVLRKQDVWFKITAEDADGQPVEGWMRRGPVFVEDATVSSTGRVEQGTGAKEWTLDYVKRMVRDRNFVRALTTTALLMVLILPIQFTLAIIMALVLQSRLKGNTFLLYIYSIPLGISDLAAGLVWVSIFTQNGFLNTFLQTLGIIDKPVIFLSPDNRHWIILAIVLAEVWRATSIVMVIVVSGLQAIPQDFLEAGDLFGATLWQRLRHIILPLLKPSLQVALILRTILAFQVFAVVIAIAGNVPEVITVLANETYRWYAVNVYNNANVAAAYAGFIMLISLSIAVLYLRLVRTQEEREAQK